jgi:lipooligosaccharide transport system permease protein
MADLRADQLHVQRRGLPIGEGVGRLFDYWLTVYKRTWKASVVSSFASPLLYVLAMGVFLGGFVQDDPAKLEGAPTYLAFVVPGLIAAHAMQTAVGETTYPVMGLFKWGKVYDSMIATPLQIRHVVTAHLVFVAFRLATTCGVYMLVLTPFGVYQSWWGPPLAFVCQVLVGMAFAAITYAFTTRIKSEASFGLLFRLGVFPLFLFSGAFFPVDNLGPVGELVAKLTPLWHGVNLSRMFCITPSPGGVDWTMAAVNVAYLVVLLVLGWHWAVSGLAKKLIT